MNTTPKVAFYAGSFDPPTIGHLAIIREAAKVFDRVIVGVGVNSTKIAMFLLEERKQMLEAMLHAEGVEGITVVSYEGLTVEEATRFGARVLLRGLRSMADYEPERELAFKNALVDTNMVTMYLATPPEFMYVSSTSAREFLAFDRLRKHASRYLHPLVMERAAELLSQGET
jgi:pantetheine-phosphate adenylyltransferase